ncbi:pectinesterase [Musa troglodytarum]|uniref:Pectinesterase n=1 Tax=Musa troglodytarum TaxID=320322 RepID=A0A9E7FG72_9LILI|nr:pectinesterase [Musa troglodytarum]
MLESVEFLSHKDTLYTHSLRRFYKSYCISGIVNFIFSNSATVFCDYLIFILPHQLNPKHNEFNIVTVHDCTDPTQSINFVFSQYTINESYEYLMLYHSKLVVHHAYLEMPWKGTRG